MAATVNQRVKINLRENGIWEFWVKIVNFIPELGETGQAIDTNFMFGRASWLLQIFPKGQKSDCSDFMSLFMRLTNSSLPFVDAKWEFTLLGKSDNVKIKNLEHQFSGVSNVFGWYKFAARSSLFDKEKGFIEDGNLMLHGKVEIMNPKFLLEDVAFPTPISSKPGFRTKMFCDLTLKVGDKSIKANKIFLAEASRTFYRQLTQNESRRQIEITDLSFEVAEQMIEFIYEDKIEDMARYAKDLLVAANLYEFRKLKKYCENYLYNQLTVQNSIETLKFATQNQATELKIECIESVARQIQKIPKTDWETFISGYPETFNDLFRLCISINFPKIVQYFKTEYIYSMKQEKLVAQPVQSMCRDFEFLYLNSIFSDVDLEVEGKTLKGHQSVLSSRSPRFRAILCTDISNKKRLLINNYTVETVKELLRFIYCDRVENLEEIGLSLLEAADEYELPKLVIICEQFLEISLNTQNVSKMLDISDRHNCFLLKNKAFGFFGRHALPITETPEWMNLIRKNPKLCNEIFIEFISKIFRKN